MFFPSLAVTVRRLMNLDRSGWYIAIPVGAVLVAALLLIMGTTVFASAVVTYLGMSLMIAGLFIQFALLIYLIKKGTTVPTDLVKILSHKDHGLKLTIYEQTGPCKIHF